MKLSESWIFAATLRETRFPGLTMTFWRVANFILRRRVSLLSRGIDTSARVNAKNAKLRVFGELCDVYEKFFFRVEYGGWKLEIVGVEGGEVLV